MKRKINYELIDAMIENGYNQMELCKMVGLSNNYLSGVINGNFNMTIGVAKKLAPFLPNYDITKAISESGANILLVASVNPACKMIVDLLYREQITQRELAGSVGVACSSLNYILSGRLMLSYKIARRIQQVYPDFNAAKAVDLQSEVYGSKCTNSDYQQKWRNQQLQNS